MGIEHAITHDDNVVPPLGKIDADWIDYHGVQMSWIHVHAWWISETDHCRTSRTS